RVFFRTNDAKVGTLVGEDKYGNKYYEDNKQFFDEETEAQGSILTKET
ncbi:NDUFA12 isoform 6, partial [Pongo abelii]